MMAHPDEPRPPAAEPPFLAPPPALGSQRTWDGGQQTRRGNLANAGTLGPGPGGKRGFAVDEIEFPSVLRPRDIIMERFKHSAFQTAQVAGSASHDLGASFPGTGAEMTKPPWTQHSAILKQARLAPATKKSRATPEGRNTAPGTATSPEMVTGRVTRSRAVQGIQRPSAAAAATPGPAFKSTSKTVEEASRAGTKRKRQDLEEEDEGLPDTKPKHSPTGRGTSPTATPAIPWSLYGIDDEQETVGKPVGDGLGATRKNAEAQATATTISDDADALLEGASTSQPQKRPSPLSTASAGKRRRKSIQMLPSEQTADDGERQRDPHDPAMADDYIPLGPGPMPRLPKGTRKRPKKQRPEQAAEENRTEAATAGRRVEGTPPPTPPAAPPKMPRSRAVSQSRFKSSRPPKQPREADPTIWTPEGRPAPRHRERDWPAHPGNIYCEVCFRDDCARWIEVRDGVLRVLRLLGGGAALQELRQLAQQAADAEAESVRQHVLTQDEGRPRKLLRSPPPVPSSSESSPSGGSIVTNHAGGQKRTRKGKAPAKKVVILTDAGTRAARALFHDNPSDVVGLVLLRVVAERRTPRLDQAEKAEVSELLEELRRETGPSIRQFSTLTAQCKALLAPRRSRRARVAKTNSPGSAADVQAEAERWWWEFDQALQDAHRQHSAELHALRPFSAFARMLAKKAQEVTAGILSTSTAAAVGRPRSSSVDDEFAQLDQLLGPGTPRDVLLKRIGDRLAQARWKATNKDNAAPSPQPRGKRRRDEADEQPADAPPSKRARTSQQHTGARPPSDTAAASTSTPLPCIYCAESAASNRQAARRPFPRMQDPKPWVRPLTWALGFKEDAAARVTAEEFFRVVGSMRGAEEAADVEVDVGGISSVSVRFMVDVTGGETRVVLVEMGSVFDALGVGVVAGPWSRRKTVRFGTPVAVWEKWEDGKLDGYNVL